MKKTKKIFMLGTFGFSSAFILGTLFASSLPLMSSDKIEYKDIESLDTNPDNYISNPVKNNQIYNNGGPNYQYQEILSQDEVNDPNTFNRNNVLSAQSILTVRNEFYYFNFIKSPDTTTYHIMTTPVDPTSLIDPIKTPTDFMFMNGSALWIKDRLVIMGSRNANTMVLKSYTQDFETGELTLETELIANAETNAHLFKLQNVEEKVVSNWPGQSASATLVPYKTSAQPIYLSPVENFSNSKNGEFSLIAWTNQYNYSQWISGEFTPVHITYDPETGFSANAALSMAELNDNVTLPIDPQITEQTTPFSKEVILSAKIMGVTPMIDKNNKLQLFVHSIGSKTNGILLIFVSQVTLNSGSLEIVQFMSSSIRADDRPASQVVVRDPMNYLPYGMLAKGDGEDSSKNSKTTNLFWFVGAEIAANSFGVGTNVLIDENNQLSSVAQQQIKFYQAFGPIFTNFLFLEQMYYPPERDLSQGIYIGIRYRGVGSGTRAVRVGTLKWQTPWNPDTWSNTATWYGTTVVSGYSASEDTVSGSGDNAPNAYSSSVAPTVWNNIYSIPGIYEAQQKPAVAGDPPIIPEKRQAAKVLTRDLKTNNNLYNTQIPKNIILSSDQNLSPDVLGSDGVGKIISAYSQNYPAAAAEIAIKNFDFQAKNNFLKVNGNLSNPYINGLQNFEAKPIEFDVRLQHPPTKEEIATPILVNLNENRMRVPSVVETPINESFTTPGILNEISGIIGINNSDLIQVNQSMIPYITSLSATPDDFLGSLTIKYTIKPVNGPLINGEIVVQGFWGNVYIIPIILGSIIIIVGIVLITFWRLKRKHRENLSMAISEGFKLHHLNKNKKVQNSNFPGSKPSNGPPGSNGINRSGPPSSGPPGSNGINRSGPPGSGPPRSPSSPPGNKR